MRFACRLGWWLCCYLLFVGIVISFMFCLREACCFGFGFMVCGLFKFCWVVWADCFLCCLVGTLFRALRRFDWLLICFMGLRWVFLFIDVC